jgi:VanZ family protein
LTAIVWLLVIALESTALGSAENTGRILLPLLRAFFGEISRAAYLEVHYYLRKAGHFFGYAVLSLMMFRAWWATVAISDGTATSWRDMLYQWSARAALLAAVSTAAVAGLDELHQTMLAGRTGQVSDVILDSLAGLFTQMALIAVSKVHALPRRSPLALSR